MARQVHVDWPTCDEKDCISVRLDAGKCLAHAENQARKAALEQVAQTAKVDARGVALSRELMDDILAAVPDGPDGHRRFTNARFDGATFESDARFDGATFKGDVTFDGATFESDAWFGEATFKGDVTFGGATFTSRARFDEATFWARTWFDEAAFTDDASFVYAIFTDDARFGEATFKGGAWFDRATFQDRAWFGGAAFTGDAGFSGATFTGHAGFSGATFTGDAGFSGATFTGHAEFSGATFTRDARFDDAVFERAQQFGPILACQLLSLDGAQFNQPVVIEASTPGLRCRRARFPGGVQFRLRWARVMLDDADLSVASLFTGIPRLAGEKLAGAEQRAAEDWRQKHGISGQPRIASLRRANVAALGLSNVDLAESRFAGAHNLDLLRLDGDITLGLSPVRAAWERRQVIAEEAEWRASRGRQGWQAPPWPDWAGDKPEPLDPGAIAGLYRALRKGREDAKDEPGAADFYYGEMEMRRHATGPVSERETGSRGRVDRGVLTAYWLASGYGLRVWRAVAWLAGIVAAFGLLFHLYGFIKPPAPDGYWTSLLYAFRSTLSLSGDDLTLNAWGDLLQALLRITGPVLLGLGLLALRGRVKR